MTRHKRRIKLIQPRLQLKLIFVFLGMAASSMLLQFILFTSNVTEVATTLPADGLILVEELPALLYRTLLVSFLLFLPLMFFVGVLVTFRIAGPLYRFEVYLKQVIRGEKPPDCRLREGDELQGLCRLINEATAPLRVRPRAEEEQPAATGAESEGGLERAA
jgi:signal peptidase II